MILLFLAFFLQQSAFAESPPKLTLKKLALNWKAEPQFGGFYEAAFTGLYKKAGFDVQIQEGGSGTPTLQMIQNGTADYGIISGEEILLAKNKAGSPSLTAVFAAYQKSPLIIMTHPERGFKTLEDVFKNEGILSVQAGLTYFLFLKKKFGEPKARVVPYSGGVGFFLSNQQHSQQGFLTSEPLLAEKAGQKPQVFLVSEYGFRPYNTVLVLRTDELRKNRESVQKFVQATREGWKNYLKDPDPTNQKMGQINKSMDQATFSLSAEAQKPLIQLQDGKQDREIGAMTQSRWDEVIDLMKDISLLKKDLKPVDLFENL